jgi:hypothetical protein
MITAVKSFITLDPGLRTGTSVDEKNHLSLAYFFLFAQKKQKTFVCTINIFLYSALDDE